MRWGVEGEYSQDLFESLPSSEEKNFSESLALN
jgi:hypothetical protein